MAIHTVDERDVSTRLRDFQAMLDAITYEAIMWLDIDGNIATWSSPAATVMGYDAEEVLGRPVAMFYLEEDQASGVLERRLDEARESGRSQAEGWRLRKNGTKFWASVVDTPVHDDDGSMVGYVVVIRDLTERVEIENRLNRQWAEILELSIPVIQVWDKVLALPIIGSLDSARAARLTEALLERIAENQDEIVILDITGVPTVDTQVAQHLILTVQATRLMGAQSILSGVRPETAQSMVGLGIDLSQMEFRHSLRDALQLALRLLRNPDGVLSGAGHEPE